MATKLPSGSYRSQVFIGYKNGKRQYKSFTADTAKKANYMALQWQAAHPNLRAAGVTLNAAMGQYLRIKSDVLSPSTLWSYSLMMNNINENKIADKELDQITKTDMQTFINSLAVKLAPKTVRNYYGLISTVFRENDLEPPKVTLPQKVKPEYNIPDEDTIRAVFALARGTNLEIPILLGAIGPMRRGEIVGSRIDDLDGDILHVHRCAVMSDHGEVTKEYPKNYSSDRYIMLPHDVAEKIREQGYIYDGSLNSLSKAFPKLLKCAGIKKFRFHDLRHAFVSIAHAAGLPDAYIQARGGWSSPYTMNAVYKHTLNADSKKAQETVNDVFQGLMQHDLQHDNKKSG